METRKQKLLNANAIERELRLRNIPATADWLRAEAEQGRIPCVIVNRHPMFRLDAVLSALTERAKGVPDA